MHTADITAGASTGSSNTAGTCGTLLDDETGLQTQTVKWLEGFIGGSDASCADRNGELFVSIDENSCLYGLKGTRCFPDLSLFSYLREIRVSFTGVVGELPPSIGNCTLLEVIEMGNNMLTGSVGCLER